MGGSLDLFWADQGERAGGAVRDSGVAPAPADEPRREIQCSRPFRVQLPSCGNHYISIVPIRYRRDRRKTLRMWTS